MPKPTFKEFLSELQYGEFRANQDLAQRPPLPQQQTQQNAFSQAMANSPKKGDVIQHGGANHVVTNLSMQGVHTQQLGGNKATNVFPHGTQFNATGQTTGAGKPIFNVQQ